MLLNGVPLRCDVKEACESPVSPLYIVIYMYVHEYFQLASQSDYRILHAILTWKMNEITAAANLQQRRDIQHLTGAAAAPTSVTRRCPCDICK